MNGYRLQLRVVEEYDVALLAESPDDAKARAEADLRRGDQFETSRTAGPKRSSRSKRWPGSRTRNSSRRCRPRHSETSAGPPTSSSDPTHVVNAWLRLIATMNS